MSTRATGATTTYTADKPPLSSDALACPASFAQGRMWFLQQLAPDSSAYNLCIARRLYGALDVPALAAALTALVTRHESLRTTFSQQAGEPMQVIHPPPTAFPLAVVPLAAASEPDRQERIASLVAAEADRPFDLETGPLLRMMVVQLDEGEQLLITSMHHIISDGWSLATFFQELSVLYLAAVPMRANERTPDTLLERSHLAPLAIQYADFALWQREWLSGDELARQDRYWTECLASPLPILTLQPDHPRPAQRRGRGAECSFVLSSDLTKGVHTLARHEGTTLFMTLLAAYQVLLSRYSGQDDIIVGSPIAGRTRTETEGLIGFFVNTLALRTDLSGAPTFRELLGRVRKTTLGAFANQDLPFERLVQLVQPGRDASQMPLFQTMLVLQNAKEAQDSAATLLGMRTAPFPIATTTSKFDLQVTFVESRGRLRGSMIYDPDIFEAATIERMAKHLERVLEAAVAAPDTRIGDLSLLPPSERLQVVSAWNDTTREYPRDATIHELFAEVVARAPTAVAAELGSDTITYAQLDASSTELAQRLRAMGVVPGARVGVCVERSFAMLAALLGVLKAGAAYVPLDPEYPAERLTFMLDDAQLSIIVAQRHIARVLDGPIAAVGAAVAPRVVFVDATTRRAKREDPDGDVRATSPAYVMYTSGSTGRPKGVVVPHRAVIRLVRNTDFARLDASEVILGFAPISFDASTLEIWGALLNGGRIALCPPGRPLPADIGDIIARHNVTTAWLTAALFHKVVDASLPRLRGLRQLLAGGDVLSIPHVQRVLDELPDTQLINGYGPTENTTFTCCHAITRVRNGRSIPIGRPIANTTAYILDAQMQPVPIGVPGELYTGGDGVAVEYLNRPELTAERFVADPFSTRHEARLYRTGDRARWLADGTIEFLGRFDDQVKLRGFRVEPGEVEAALGAHPAIAQAAVVVRRDPAGEARLIGYFVVRGRGTLSVTDLRAYLRDRLPEYMIPAVLFELPALAIGPTGKLDRTALPVPEALPLAGERPHARPRTTLEHELVHLWERLLPVRPIGITDDFFELGGHSLLAAQMLFEIEQLRERRIPLSALFEGATIERIASLLEAAVEDAGEPSVTVVQEDGSRIPFVYVHGDVRGGGWYCRRLAALLGADQPLVMLPTLRSADGGGALTIEAMAATHVESLCAVQPHGPYYLGGFCVGGLVAFEIARQLQARGESVERVVLIDAPATNARFRLIEPVLDALLAHEPPARRMESRARWIMRLLRARGVVRRVWRVARRDGLRSVVAKVAARSTEIFARARPITEPSVSLPSAEFLARPATQVLRMQERAATAYIPHGYDGIVDVIWASDEFRPISVNQTWGWDRVASGVRPHVVESEHVGLITYNLPALAAIIRTCLHRDERA